MQADDEQTDVPACTSCRQRKLKCSREKPVCTHCIRLHLTCEYEARQKPGLKAGAVEALSRRVALLESFLLDTNGRPYSRFLSEQQSDGRGNARDLSFSDQLASRGQIQPEANLRASLSGRANEHSTEHVNEESSGNKRRRTDSNVLLSVPGSRAFEMVQLIDYFCVSFHHWIPFLHKARIKHAVRDPNRSTELDIVFQAIHAAIARDEANKDNVVRVSMQAMSIERVQALVIIVFGLLNDGDLDRAWPLIGSLTRTVDYLQLTMEPSKSRARPLMRPLRFVPPTHDLTELEERRRLFWVVFLLDRFCSVFTGWTTGLNAEDVHRRLPADGGYFTREEPASTPFFGIWTKSAAKIGRSLAHVAPQYNEDVGTGDNTRANTPIVATEGRLPDSSKLGAFAYCVEATESLAQVATFFLQQPVMWTSKQGMAAWLTRFKELDLRLVQWKTFLPRKWKDADIASDRTRVNMDPNLTVAHLTHNTSMILLHHSVAYPPAAWSNTVPLPSSYSAATCRSAALETFAIADKFLRHTDIDFVNYQFTFCVYVAAKFLLYQHEVDATNDLDMFHSLVACLRNISQRWMRSTRAAGLMSGGYDQAQRFATHLIGLYHRSRENPAFRLDMYDHAGSTLREAAATPSTITSPTATHQTTDMSRGPSFQPLPGHGFPNATEVLPRASIQPQDALFHGQVQGQGPEPFAASSSANNARSMDENVATQNTFAQFRQPEIEGDNLLDISDLLMQPQFTDFDRVITYNDANFFMPNGATW